MAGVLEGIRVVDMGHVIAIPATGALLADWGAEVIKVEPLSGDMYRGTRKIINVDRILEFSTGEVDWIIEILNRNKRSIAVDLKKKEGRNIVYKLVQNSDVFMSNYRLKSLKRLGLDYATLSSLNPRLVYGVLTGYGTDGPDKDERGFDYSAAWARSGMQHIIGEPESIPSPQRPGMMDMATAGYIASSILAALLRSEKTGRGQELELSLYHTAVWILAPDIQGALMGRPLPKHDRTKALNPLWNSYNTKDNRWLQLVMLQAVTHWPNFCRAIERPELESDPRFNTDEKRAQHCEELICILDEVIAAKNSEEWEARFKENGCTYGRVQSPVEVTNDPQAIANGFFTETCHPIAGEMKLVASPVHFYETPASVRTSAPAVGEHTEEILLSLGYSWDDIAHLKEQEVIL